jgi:hypothetical protein
MPACLKRTSSEIFFEICGPLTGQNGITLQVRTIWLPLVRPYQVCYLVAGQENNIMNLPLYTEAALSCDLPEQGLRRGDVVKLVDELKAPDGTPGYSVEVLNAFVTPSKSRLCPLGQWHRCAWMKSSASDWLAKSLASRRRLESR